MTSSNAKLKFKHILSSQMQWEKVNSLEKEDKVSQAVSFWGWASGKRRIWEMKQKNLSFMNIMNLHSLPHSDQMKIYWLCRSVFGDMSVCERGMSFSITINVHPYGEAGEAVPRAGGRGLSLPSCVFFLSQSDSLFLGGGWRNTYLSQREREKHIL